MVQGVSDIDNRHPSHRRHRSNFRLIPELVVTRLSRMTRSVCHLTEIATLR